MLEMTRKHRAALMQSALGKARADVIFTEGQLVNVYSAEILPNLWVALKGDRIFHVGPPNNEIKGDETTIVSLEGRFILPGFIDGHTHLDNIFQPGAYAAYALAYGNTTAVSEVAMAANAMGVKGVEYFIDEIKGLPLRVYILAPPLVPPSPELETSRPFPSDYFRKLLLMDRCLGVGETYWNRLLDFEGRSLDQYHCAHTAGKTREGHAAGAKAEKLMAYAAAGTSSCHEATSLEEALERLRLGMSVMIREGFVRRELTAISGIAGESVDLANVMMVTDMADPEELVSEGGMNLLLKQAVKLGFDPVKAVQMITINVARYFKMEDLGGVGPGKIADLVIVDDLKDFHCHQVWAGGRLMARNGKLIKEIEPYCFPEQASHSITIERVEPDVFRIPFTGSNAKVRAVETLNETITGEILIDMKASQGELGSDPSRDILKAAVFRKDSPGTPPGFGFVRGIGLYSGAVATSLTWDTNNILVVGTTDQEMADAVNRLIRLGGGMVVVNRRNIIGRLPLPLCGITSPEPLPKIVSGIKEVQDAFRTLGSRLTRPFLTLQTFCFTGLPFLRLTDKGLVDIKKGKLVSLLVSGF